MRLPSQSPDARDLIRLMSLQLDDSDLTVMSAEEYLRPQDLETEHNDDFFHSNNSQRRPLACVRTYYQYAIQGTRKHLAIDVQCSQSSHGYCMDACTS